MKIILCLFCSLFLLLSVQAEERAGAVFKEGSGIILSEETEQSIGLKIAEVEDRSLTAQHNVTAQVYQEADEANEAAASVMVSAKIADQLKAGGSIEVTAPDNLTSTIIRLDETMKKAAGRVELLIHIPDENRNLKTGSFVDLLINENAPQDVAAIPETAVLKTIFGKFVFVVNGDALLRTPIETGGTQDGYVEVTDGLYGGDQIAASAVTDLYQIELRAAKGGGHCH